MIKGIGTDLVSVARIEKALARHGNRFAQRILGPDEYKAFLVHSRPSNFVAKRFATKEATVKALGTGFSNGISWKDVQLEHLPSGQPKVVLSNAALELYTEKGCQQILLSLSDEESLVSAFVVVE
jgi:holo-[acyl-carrier protein] synthase